MSTSTAMLHDAPVVKRRTRRRLLNRMGRASSSPHLAELGADGEYSARNSVSCISLAVSSRYANGERPATRIAEKDAVIRNVMASNAPTAAVPRTIPLQQHRNIPRNFLEILPGEICLQVLSYLEPKELIRCSMVRFHRLPPTAREI